MTKRLPFHLDSIDSGPGLTGNLSARAATFTTRQGTVVQTPMFMPVATIAAFRGISTEDIIALDFPIILSNTFHLFLRPGGATVANQGGLHQFMQWPNSILTDSGGFQIFSLANRFKLTEDGADVRSFVDGRWHHFSPEVSIRTQQELGSDILMVLDQCVPSTSESKIAAEAVALSARWAKRCLDFHGDHNAALFGIIQGACDQKLRKLSSELTCQLPFDGYAIGGLAVGEEKSVREDITEFTTQLMPSTSPRYLMGIGTPIDILEAVARGVDIFDCILPVAFGQQGEVFSSTGKLSLRRGVYKHDSEPIDKQCNCQACKKYSRAYLHHLIKCKETLGQALCGIHNLTFYRRLCSEMRQQIIAGTFESYYKTARVNLQLVDQEAPRVAPRITKRHNKPLGDYKITTKNGSNFIAQISSGEVMHGGGQFPPEVEAQKLYLEMSGLQQDLIERSKQLENSLDRTLQVFDLGLGAAHNAMALIRAHETLAPHAKVKLVSFENDLDSLKLAIKNKSFFQHLWHPAPEALLNDGQWIDPTGNFCWKLKVGDYRDQIDPTAQADYVFFDMFSQRSQPIYWHCLTFKNLIRSLSKTGKLVTYSQSTNIRAALLGAGFFVGELPGIPPKEGHTIAFKSAPVESELVLLLQQRFLERWRRSHQKFPADIQTTDEQEAFTVAIESHPQWNLI